MSRPALLSLAACLCAALSCTGGDAGGVSFPPGEVPASDKTPCAIANGHCDVNATCADSAAGPICTCKAGYVADGNSCVDVATSLGGLRWNLPCSTHPASGLCPTQARVEVHTTVGGDPAKLYSIILRFRGVAETNTYGGGTPSGHWYTGGTPTGLHGYDVYSMTVSSPPQVFYLNGPTEGIVRAIDYTETILANGGATITLVADSSDGVEGENGSIVVPDIPPAPQVFDGQFIQMDIVSVHQ